MGQYASGATRCRTRGVDTPSNTRGGGLLLAALCGACLLPHSTAGRAGQQAAAEVGRVTVWAAAALHRLDLTSAGLHSSIVLSSVSVTSQCGTTAFPRCPIQNAFAEGWGQGQQQHRRLDMVLRQHQQQFVSDLGISGSSGCHMW